MKREIKFRGWYQKEKKMMYQDELNGGNQLVMFWNVVSALHEIIPMQFTGLKDKNGKDVFEGDIFPCLYAFDGCTEHVMVVEWNKDRAGFLPRWDYEKCHQNRVTKSMLDCTRLEVIGNIYEHPHLLNPPADKK